MKYFNYKKIITIGCIVIVSATMFQPKPAQALFPDWLNAGIQVVGHGIQGTLLGFNAATSQISASLDVVKQFMEGLPIEYGPVRQGLSIAVKSCDLLGGNVSAISEINALRSPASPSFDPELSSEQDDRLVLPDPAPYSMPPVTQSGGNGTVAGVSTNSPIAANSVPSIFIEKARSENATLNGTRTLETPVVTSSTNLDPLAQSLVNIGDKSRSNLTLAITKELGLLRYQKTCYNILDSSLKNSLLIASWNQQLKQAYTDTLVEIEQRSAPVNRNVADLKERLTAAQQAVYQSLASSVASDINEQKTTETFSDLKSKLTVANYDQSIDALTKQVYAPKKIKEKYAGDLTTQYILGVLLDGEIATDSYAKQQIENNARSAVKAVISDTAGCYQDYDYATDFTDINSINEAFSAVDPQCDEVVILDSYKSKFSEVMALSKQAAQVETSNDSGFLSTRSCVAADETLKQNRIAAAETGKKLKEAFLTRKSRKITDPTYIDAVNAEKTAAREALNIPAKLNGGVEELCGDIDNSGNLTQSLLKEYVGQWIVSPTGFDENNPNLSIEHYNSLPDKLTALLFGSIENPKSVIKLFSSDGKGFVKALLTGIFLPSNNSTGSSATPTFAAANQGVLGDVTIISSDVKTVPYTSPRGDFGIDRGGR